MSKSIGSVRLDLDRAATQASFRGLQHVVNNVVNQLKPVTLKLNVKDTTKEFSELTKVLKDVASNINKINSANTAGRDSDVARKAREEAKAQKEAIQAQKEAQKAQKESERAEKDRVNSLKALYNMLRQVRELENKVKTGKGGTSSQSYQELHALGDAMQEAINKGNVTSEVVQKCGLAFAKLRAGVSESGDAIKNAVGPLDALESRIVYMLSLSNIILQSVRQFKEMFNTVVELDSAMTQLRIVTDNTDQEYTEFGKNTSKVAQEIGASAKDLINSTTTFARLGYSLSESGDLAKLTAMLSKVGDVDVSSAQNAMTAITKAFKDVDTSNIESAMDKMVAVGNNFPISVAELAEGMNNAGSALAASGNSFEQSIALLTAANTTIQNISKSSTGLRTITARIRKTKVELDDLGETITEASYQRVLDMLTGKGVSLTDENGFRTTYDILKDIAAIWDELDSKSQAAVAEQLAGKLVVLPGFTEMWK